MTICLCTHPRDVHQHYRRGSDCSACDCLAYRSRWARRLALLVVLVITALVLAALAQWAVMP